MARRFALYRKKRGDRVSGSAKLGSMGEALLSAACLLVGAVALAVILVWVIIPQWRLNQVFVETTCHVVEAPGVVSSVGEEGTVYRPKVRFEYTVDGHPFSSDRYDLLTWYTDRSSAQEIARQFQPGQTRRCWYDPEQPDIAVLVRGHKLTFWLLMLLPVAFLAVGVGGLVHALWQWSTSQERRAAIVKIATDIELFDKDSADRSKYPAVPRDTDVRNSPGTTLAYRLPIATLPGWRLFGLAGACLLWNGLVVALVILAIRKHLDGQPDWLLDLITLPFLASGIWLVYELVRQFVFNSGTGLTRIEISEHPLEPGRRYELYVSQGGRLSVRKLELLLVGEERATYRQGTDMVTDTKQVSLHSILDKTDFSINASQPFESRCEFEIPADAMHSFRSAHNAVNWKLVIRGDVEKWPDFERDFPVVVVPKTNEQATDDSDA